MIQGYQEKKSQKFRRQEEQRKTKDTAPLLVVIVGLQDVLHVLVVRDLGGTGAPLLHLLADGLHLGAGVLHRLDSL